MEPIAYKMEGETMITILLALLAGVTLLYGGSILAISLVWLLWPLVALIVLFVAIGYFVGKRRAMKGGEKKVKCRVRNRKTEKDASDPESEWEDVESQY